MILSEVFVLAISHANDNPYEGALYLARAKRVLLSATKEISEASLLKRSNEIYFALERVLFGEDGVEVLSQRLLDSSPHYVAATASSTPVTTSPLSSVSLTSSNSSLGSPAGNQTGVGGKIIDSPSSSSLQLCAPTLSKSNSTLDQSRHFERLAKFEGIVLPSSILTADDSLPKTDKNIYDPPATVKWGATTTTTVVHPAASRVSNRIMFTLRHPNASSVAPAPAAPPSPVAGSPGTLSDSDFELPTTAFTTSAQPLPCSNTPRALGGSTPSSSSPTPTSPSTTGEQYSLSETSGGRKFSLFQTTPILENTTAKHSSPDTAASTSTASASSSVPVPIISKAKINVASF
eukprot:gene6738-7832_t